MPPKTFILFSLVIICSDVLLIYDGKKSEEKAYYFRH